MKPMDYGVKFKLKRFHLLVCAENNDDKKRKDLIPSPLRYLCEINEPPAFSSNDICKIKNQEQMELH